MSCLLNTSYSVPCKSIGGLKELYIGELNSRVIYYYNTSREIYQIDNIQNYYSVELEKETASFTQVGGFSNENGTAYYTKTIEFTLHGLRQSLIEFITILGRGKWSIVFVDQTNQTWLLEAKNITNVVASTPSLGKAYGDLNGCVITMETKGPKPATIIQTGLFPSGLACEIGDVNFELLDTTYNVTITWYQQMSLLYNVILYLGNTNTVAGGDVNLDETYSIELNPSTLYSFTITTAGRTDCSRQFFTTPNL